MARIPTSIKRRLSRLRRRRQKAVQWPNQIRSTTPFRYDASLRIAGVGELHEEIARTTGILATRSHKKGETHGFVRKRVWSEDLWILDSPLGEQASPDEHLQWLWKTVSPHKAYFSALVAKATWADVCLGCLSESAYPLLVADSKSLTLLRELNIGLSFNFTCL